MDLMGDKERGEEGEGEDLTGEGEREGKRLIFRILQTIFFCGSFTLPVFFEVNPFLTGALNSTFASSPRAGVGGALAPVVVATFNAVHAS